MAPKFLILDTCGAVGGVAVAAVPDAAASDAAAVPRVIAERVLPRGRFASDVVMAVREALAESGAALSEMNAIVVMRGPGSFTGIRVGLSTAKGLAHASGVPVIALSRLGMMAAVAGEARVYVAMDAGRGEFYFGSYDDGKCIDEALLSRDAVQELVQGAKVFVCEADAFEKLTGAVDVVRMRDPVAADCIPLAARDFATGEFASLAELDANYLRAPVAAAPQSSAGE